jgi:hypothetical protein
VVVDGQRWVDTAVPKGTAMSTRRAGLAGSGHPGRPGGPAWRVEFGDRDADVTDCDWPS